MGSGRKSTHRATALLMVAAILVAGCGTFGGGDSAPASPTIANAAPDSRGVITYATYQVVVAREGDTIETVAGRVGTTPEELARRNALPLDYRLRRDEVLLLPDSVARPAGTDFAAAEVSEQPLGTTPTAASSAPLSGGETDPLIDPVRHRVEAGETAYSIARLYGVSVTALASWNGLDSSLSVREGQELLIPIVSDANRISSSPDTEPGQLTPVAPPPSAAAPLPEDIVAATEPDSPNLSQYRTPPGGRMSAPVSGTVTRPYDPARPNGIGFAVPAGTPVRAAGAGEVALISEELSGLGTIVLIRHADEVMTTYSTLSQVSVSKGDRVQAGQQIGVVAPRDNPELQFDVFRGTTSVDPTPYLGG